MESLLSVEENEDLLGLKDIIDIENILAIDLKDMGFFPEHVDEPEVVVKGNREPSAASLDQNQNGGDKDALLTNEEEHVEAVTSQDSVQRVSVTLGSSLNTVEVTEILNQRESGEHKHSLSKTSTLDVELIMQEEEAMELETSVSAEGGRKSSIPITEVGEIKETEILSKTVHEAFDFSLHKHTVAEASKPTYCSKDKSSFVETNSVEVELEILEKLKETERTFCDITTVNSTNHVDDEDIEEGEHSGGNGMDDRSSDELLQDTVVVEEQKVYEA